MNPSERHGSYEFYIISYDPPYKGIRKDTVSSMTFFILASGSIIIIHPFGTVCLKKYTLVQALRLCTGRTVHRGSRGIAPPFHDHGARRG